ncbi:hypothetical protein SLEP1_g11815 [Rubroshorea leprosula]|nr:hypothetical protein SLEP1_g11815 [Rubroshorea leprosula]
MGNFMGFVKGGMPSTQMLNLLLGTLYKQFTDREVSNFDQFHIAILDILNTFNSALPGKHYDAPLHREVEECFNRWNNADEESARKKVFIDFMKGKVKLSQLDNTTMITGLVAPPAAMAAKRAGEILPHVSIIKAVPDVIFVPAVTMAALMTSKLSRKIFMQNLPS